MLKTHCSMDSNELEICGNQTEFKQFQVVLNRVSQSGKTEVIQCEEHDPHPYETLIREITVRREESPLNFSVNANQVVIEGGQAQLKNFAVNLPYDAVPPYHIHYDSISFPEVISESTLDLVLSLD